MNLTLIPIDVLYEYEKTFLAKIAEVRDLKTEMEKQLNDPIVQDETDPVGRVVRLALEPRVSELDEILTELRDRLNHVICEILARTQP